MDQHQRHDIEPLTSDLAERLGVTPLVIGLVIVGFGTSMPELVTSVEAAEAYRQRIIAAAGDGFTPLMTCYLTDDVDPDEIRRGHEAGVWVAAKLYPANATTN